jgi:hypothetical protein
MAVGDGSGLGLNPGETVQSKIVHQVRQLMQGRSNAVGRLTLSSTGATSTSVTAITAGPGSVPLLTPLTINASNMKYHINSTDVYLGSFTVSHTSSTSTDLSFGYLVAG